MRIDLEEYEAVKTSETQEPIIVIEVAFDDAYTDLHYITSHPVNGLTGNVIESALKSVSSTSQKLNPEKALSTIGSIRFECLDQGLTELQNAKLSSDLGLNGKRIRVYVGDRTLLWSSYVLVQTQIISGSINFRDQVYVFNCADIQRAMRQKIFIPKETALVSAITKESTTINVENTSAFDAVFQPPIADSVAPSQEVGFLKISNGDVFEIIMWPVAGKQATSFTNCTRGMFGTPKLEIELLTGERGETVEEFVYLSAPALMVSYALLTGSWYGYAGKFLPSHWHLGISTDYIKTSDFIAHPDLWDTTDIDAGIIGTVKGATDEDGKKFIEEQLFFMIGVYAPIESTGEIGLKRLSSVLALGGSSRELNADNIVNYDELKYDLSSVVNRYVIQWDYSLKRDIFQRTSILIDPLSITRHKKSNTKQIQLKTLYGSDSSLRTINTHFNSLRARSASPPYRWSLTLTPDQNDLEVGDIVTVNLPVMKGINRNFEIQSTQIDWITGNVKVGLFGTTETAGGLKPDSSKTVDTTFLSNSVPAANWITSGNFAGIVSENGLTRITQNITLSGLDNLNDLNCAYYCPEDLQIDIGVVVTITKNVQLRVKGYLTNNGTIDGRGKGYLGGVENETINTLKKNVTSPPQNYGTAGGVGSVRRQPELRYFNYSGFSVHKYDSAKSGNEWKPKEAPRDAQNGLPEYALNISSSNLLKGLPLSLIGSSGDKGGWALDDYEVPNDDAIIKGLGGNAGDSGAGLVIVSAGFNNGNAGYIDLSGTAGTLGGSFSKRGITIHAGSGSGGYTGGLLLVSTDSVQYTEWPSMFGTVLERGESPRPTAETISTRREKVYNQHHYQASYGSSSNVAENLYESFAKVIYLDASVTYTSEEYDYVTTDPTFNLTEYTNTPVTVDGDQSSIEVSVTPPGDSNYSYSEVDYRVKGTTAWLSAMAASHESVIQVSSLGQTYEIRVRPVSKAGNATLTGEIKEITVSNVGGRSNAALAVLYPFDVITNLALQGETGNYFTGRDISLGWDNDNALYAYFNHYQIDLYSGAQLLRTEKSVSPFYLYNYEKNAVDYQRINGSQGIYANIDVHVKPVSRYFNSDVELYTGAAATINILAQALSPESITLSYAGSNAILSWPETSQKHLTITATLEYNGDILAETTGNSFVVPIEWVGSRTFYVEFSYLAGHPIAPIEITVNPSKPATPVVTARVIANSVTLNYSSVKGSLPIDRYEIRRGGTYDAGQTPEIKAGTSSFTVSDEVAAGTVVFWFEAVDTAGNRSAPVSVSAIVSQPQNYQLLAQYSAKDNSWPGTLTNCQVTDSNSLLLPINTTETWAQHFTNNSFNSPQDQINAGYDYYLQPSTSTAQYQFTYDYLSLIDSATITANSAPILLDGSVVVAVHIEYSDDNTTWTSGGAGQTQILATDFRYIRVTLDFTASGGDDLAYVEDVLISIDKRVDDDSGKFLAVSTDTNGTRVYFNKDFIDAQTPSVSVSSTEIVDVIVDFNDIPDPEYFDVYVFSRSTGLRINANCSWVVRGFTRIGT